MSSPSQSNAQSTTSHEGFPTEPAFEVQVSEYLSALNPRKRDKALMTDRMYGSVLSVLRDPRNTTLETAQFRFWVKKMFRLVTTAHAYVVTHENRPVAVKSQIYEILVQCHNRASHGGRDKTSAQVRQYYSWIPKELIARFVKICPICNARRYRTIATEVEDPAYPNQASAAMALVSVAASTPKRRMQEVMVTQNSIFAPMDNDGAMMEGAYAEPANGTQFYPDYMPTMPQGYYDGLQAFSLAIEQASQDARPVTAGQSSSDDSPLPTPSTDASFSGQMHMHSSYYPQLQMLPSQEGDMVMIQGQDGWYGAVDGQVGGIEAMVEAEGYRKLRPPALDLSATAAYQHLSMDVHGQLDTGHLSVDFSNFDHYSFPAGSPLSSAMSSSDSGSSFIDHLYPRTPLPTANLEHFPERKLEVQYAQTEMLDYAKLENSLVDYNVNGDEEEAA